MRRNGGIYLTAEGNPGIPEMGDRFKVERTVIISLRGVRGQDDATD